MSEQMWVVDFDDRRFAGKGYHAFSWGDMRAATTADLVDQLVESGELDAIRWCATHDSKMPGGWGECHWNYRVVRSSPVECVETERWLVKELI